MTVNWLLFWIRSSLFLFVFVTFQTNIYIGNVTYLYVHYDVFAIKKACQTIHVLFSCKVVLRTIQELVDGFPSLPLLIYFQPQNMISFLLPLCLCPLLSLFVPLHPFLSVTLSFLAFSLLPVCGPWQCFQPSYPGSVDVRPGLID